MATAVALVAGGASAQTPSAPGATQSIRITPENVRLNNYLHDLAGPGAFIGVIGGGVLDQLRHKNDGVGGMAGRIGSNATQLVVQTSVRA